MRFQIESIEGIYDTRAMDSDGLPLGELLEAEVVMRVRITDSAILRKLSCPMLRVIFKQGGEVTNPCFVDGDWVFDFSFTEEEIVAIGDFMLNRDIVAEIETMFTTDCEG